MHITEDELIKYFSGEVAIEEANEIEQWISLCDENKKIAEQIYFLFFASETIKISQQVDPHKALKQVNKRIDNEKRKLFLQRLQKIAAVLFIPLFLCSIALLYQLSNQSVNYVELRTNPGMVTSVVLPDNSRVWLNSESYIKYPDKFKGDVREVTIEGEVYFEVEKDVEHKFIVNTPHDVKIEVLGTRFNINAYDTDNTISTTLVSGKVNLLYNDRENVVRKVEMVPNQRSVVHLNGGYIDTRLVNVLPDIAWKDGKIILENTPFEEVLKILSNRFNVQFIIKREELKKNSFSGTFVHQRLDRILEHFQISSNIQFRYVDTKDSLKNSEKSIIEIY